MYVRFVYSCAKLYHHTVLKVCSFHSFSYCQKTKCYKEYSELPWNPPEVVPICLSSHLKTISIKGFKARRVEMELAKYLLNSGYVLNKMTLYTGFLFTDAEELYKEVFMFHRATNCQVKFIKM